MLAFRKSFFLYTNEKGYSNEKETLKFLDEIIWP